MTRSGRDLDCLRYTQEAMGGQGCARAAVAAYLAREHTTQIYIWDRLCAPNITSKGQAHE